MACVTLRVGGTFSCGAAVALVVWSLWNSSSPPRYEAFAHLDDPVSFLPPGLLCCSQPWAGRKAQGVCTALSFLVLAGCVEERASKASECFGCALATGGVWLQHWHRGCGAPTCALSPWLLRNNLLMAGQPHGQTIWFWLQAADQNSRPAFLFLAVPASALWPQAKPLLPSLPAVPLPVSHH